MTDKDLVPHALEVSFTRKYTDVHYPKYEATEGDPTIYQLAYDIMCLLGRAIAWDSTTISISENGTYSIPSFYGYNNTQIGKRIGDWLHLSVPTNYGGNAYIGKIKLLPDSDLIHTLLKVQQAGTVNTESYEPPEVSPPTHLLKTAALILYDTLNQRISNSIADDTKVASMYKDSEKWFVPYNSLSESVEHACAVDSYVSCATYKDKSGHTKPIAGTYLVANSSKLNAIHHPRDSTGWHGRAQILAHGWSRA